MRVTQYGAGPVVGGEETVSYLKVDLFSFAGKHWKGDYARVFKGFPFLRVVEGTYELTRKDWNR